MTRRKYEFIKSEARKVAGHTLFRIRALVDIPLHQVKAGDYGGFIESEDNLPHYNNSWVGGDAAVYGTSLLSREVLVHESARVFNSPLQGKLVVSGSARLGDCQLNARNVTITGHVELVNVNIELADSLFQGKSVFKHVFGRTTLDSFVLEDEALVVGNPDNRMLIGGYDIRLCGDTILKHVACLMGTDISIRDHAVIENGVTIHGIGIHLSGHSLTTGQLTLRDNVVISELAHVSTSKEGTAIENRTIGGDAVVDISRI